MHSCLLSPEAYAFLLLLVDIQPHPQSVWLIGSRANGRATAESDTDFLIFADETYAATARRTLAAPVAIDVLVVHDGNHFADIWQEKRGSLDLFRWRRIDSTRAAYIGTEFVPDIEGDDDLPQSLHDTDDLQLGQGTEREEVALLVWPSDV